MRAPEVIESIDQAISSLEAVLAYLDRIELQLSAVHVSMALETLSPNSEDSESQAKSI
jgi:hypothetical protein